VKVLLKGGLGSVHERDLLDQRNRISGIGKLSFVVGYIRVKTEKVPRHQYMESSKRKGDGRDTEQGGLRRRRKLGERMTIRFDC
jgi:hypothetical protein